MPKFEMVRQEKSPEDAAIEAKKEKEEKDLSTELAADWIIRQLSGKGAYIERIPLNKDRSFNILKNVTEHRGPMIARHAHQMDMTQSGLYELAREISTRHQDLKFSFRNDKDWNWIEYSVRRETLNVGDEVVWENQGVMHWKTPKKIITIQKDEASKRKFAFFGDSKTGIPIDELVRGKNNEG